MAPPAQTINNGGIKALLIVIASVLLGGFIATSSFVVYQSSGRSQTRSDVQLGRRVQAGEQAGVQAQSQAPVPVPVPTPAAPTRVLPPFTLPRQTDLKCSPDLLSLLNVTRQEAYVKEYKKQVSGWLHRVNLIVSMALMRAQTRACIVGSIGEIGVHHGAFFIGLTLSSLPTERRLAMDVFFEGRKDKLIANAQHFGIPPSQYETITGDSRAITAQTFLQRKVPAFRFFSVDGGHDYQVTLNDLNIGAMVLAPGGIMVLDDYQNEEYPGLDESVVDFLSVNKRVAPFLLVNMKLFFTTVDYYDTYYALSDKLPLGPCTIHTAAFKTEYMLRGWNICIKRFNSTFDTVLLSELADLTIEHPKSVAGLSS